MDEIDIRQERLTTNQAELTELLKLERPTPEQEARKQWLINVVRTDTQFLAGAQAMLDRFALDAANSPPPAVSALRVAQTELQECHEKIAEETVSRAVAGASTLEERATALRAVINSLATEVITVSGATEEVAMAAALTEPSPETTDPSLWQRFKEWLAGGGTVEPTEISPES